jgi:hypothetical protein
MCFGGGNKAPPPPPPAPAAGVLDLSKAAPDPSQADRYRGGPAAENTTGRYGGSLLLDAAETKKATTLGGGA